MGSSICSIGLEGGTTAGAAADVIGPLEWTPPAEGIRETIEIFRRAAKEGQLDVDRVLAADTGPSSARP